MSLFTRRQVLRLGGATLVVSGVPGIVYAAAIVDVDVVVYGATSAGIAAAVQTRRMGRTAVILEPGTHLGGLSTGGLGMTDSGTKESIGGIAGEFYRRVHAEYAGTVVTPTSPARFTFEPRVARAVFDDLLSAAGVPVYYSTRLSSVTRAGTRITEIVADNGQVFRAPMFIDCSYEGDLMAGAGVGWTAGREANSVYGETINGVQLRDKHQFTLPVSPYRLAGDPNSGLLPGIAANVAPNGTADGRIQAYNFRMCLTQAANRGALPATARLQRCRL